MKKSSGLRQPSSTVFAELGIRLRTARLAAGLSLATLAARLKVTKGYLSRLESGKTKPSLQLIKRFAEAIGTDPDSLYFLGGYLPVDVKQILNRHPMKAAALLREAFSEYTTKEETAEPIAGEGFRPLDMRPAGGKRSGCKSLYQIVHADCFDWLDQRAPNSIHAFVTDPPYGLKEFTSEEKNKLRQGRGGVWRIPPSFDGHTRSPLPRFTILTPEDRAALKEFFTAWAKKAIRVLVPGGHVLLATNPLVSHLVYSALEQIGFEKRGEIIRLVQTLRGGDRPKNAHKEFEGVTVMPRSCWEPWGLFRKPCLGRVQDNLREWKTGGLRRISAEQPFCDVIKSAPTRGIEREIAPHPALKPQAFMRQIVRAALPLGEGVILDPFMGAGSTLAAACAVGYHSIGIESDAEFYGMAVDAIPKLAALDIEGNGSDSQLAVQMPGQGALFEL